MRNHENDLDHLPEFLENPLAIPEEILHGISIDLRELEGELFNIKIRNEINVAPMKNYI
jgi:hypothetical protein